MKGPGPLHATPVPVHLVGLPTKPLPVRLVPTPHDNAWLVGSSVATALFTLGLLVVAAWALIVARRQLGTVKDERTVKLIEEASSTMESLLGFFDFAADVRVSRAAFSELFKRLITARPAEVRTDHVEDTAKASQVVLRLIEADLDGTDPEHRDTLREEQLRERILTVTNFLERVNTLISKDAINGDLFLQSEAYNVVAPYYVLEPILNDLQTHEGFDFNDARSLATLAQPHLNWLPNDHILRTTSFNQLPLQGTTLRAEGA